MLEIVAAVLPMVVMAVIFVAVAITAIRATDGAGRRTAEDKEPRTRRSARRRTPPEN